MIHDTAENIIRLAAAHVASGTPADRACERARCDATPTK